MTNLLSNKYKRKAMTINYQAQMVFHLSRCNVEMIQWIRVGFDNTLSASGLATAFWHGPFSKFVLGSRHLGSCHLGSHHFGTSIDPALNISKKMADGLRSICIDKTNEIMAALKDKQLQIQENNERQHGPQAEYKHYIPIWQPSKWRLTQATTWEKTILAY